MEYEDQGYNDLLKQIIIIQFLMTVKQIKKLRGEKIAFKFSNKKIHHSNFISSNFYHLIIQLSEQ